MGSLDKAAEAYQEAIAKEPQNTHALFGLASVEISVLLANILKQEGNGAEARDRLETMIAKVRASPIYHYRRHKRFVNQAEKLLKTLR
jgi:tetratricopeptide (TPR) repeat protein